MRIVVLAMIAVLSAAAPEAARADSARTVAEDGSTARRCSTLTPSAAAGPGVAEARYVPAETGLVTVTLRADRGDWDLVVLDERSGYRHDASSWSGARERVLAAATPGRPLIALACRRAGAAGSARIAFDLHPQVLPSSDFPARLVRVPLTGAGAHEALEATGLDVTHNETPEGTDVVLYSAAEQAQLTAAGFSSRVLIEDMRAHDALDLQRSPVPLPSGQAQYRTPAEYAEQLKSLPQKYPGLARSVVIGESIDGQPIEGVELARDVNATDDGRPTFLILGIHHAREWPGGEMPMEFALELSKLYGTDPRVTALLDRVRVLAVPVVNPDGFAISRAAGPAPSDDQPFATLPLALSDSAAYKRKNCRPAVGSEDVPCASRPALQGVDLNRNYGAFYGGVGTSTEPIAQNFRGAGPYSEPEAEAVRRLSSTRMITTVITHHTFTDEGVWLRQPGFCKTAGACTPEVDVVPDEAGMRELGDAMGAATTWRSALGWDIGEITGATEDWNYFAQGAYGYTPEQRGQNFHPNYEDAVVREYTGEDAGGAGGVREALLRAAEQSGDPRFHGILKGSAPAGRVLRLTKVFDTATSLPEIVVKDRLDFTMTVPPIGRFSWHVNPSTRPLATAPEAYTLTCETAAGAVLERRDVVVARGAVVAADLLCGTVASPVVLGPTVAGRRLSIRTTTLGARRSNRSRRATARLRVTGGSVTALRVRLLRGRRTLASGSLARLDGTRSARLKLRRGVRLRPGRHRLVVTARVGSRRIGAKRNIRVTR